MKRRRENPPQWMDWLIECYCRKDKLEDLQGDLHEYYARNLSKSRWRADLTFLIDVVKFCRLYTIRKPKNLGQMTFFHLMGNYFKTSVRSIARNKLFSSINIVGLAFSMSIGVLMITYLQQATNFDKFHEKGDRIYKVHSKYVNSKENDILEVASNSVYLADKIKEEYPGAEEVLIVQGWATKDFTFGEKTLQLKGKYASEAFFKMLSFDLLQGHPETALTEPRSVVLTETAAKKMFVDQDPMGKLLESNGATYTVTGVMKDPPKNTHLAPFEMLESFSTQRNLSKEKPWFSSWTNMWNFHVYVLLDEAASEKSMDTFLQELSETENAKNPDIDIQQKAILIGNLLPGNGESNRLGPYINWIDIYRLLVLTVLILASACFNYTNLSIARSLRRAKEVGIRKVVGANQKQIFTQFLFEASLISLIALFFSYGLFLLIKGEFVREVINDESISLGFEIAYLPLYMLFALGIGLIAGFVPAIILSRLKAISIFRDATKIRLFKGLTLRKLLIIFQFTISLALIVSATIAYRQYMFSVNYNLGFKTENILNIDLHDTNVDVGLLENAFAQVPEVQDISTSMMLPATQSMYMSDISYGEDTVNIYYNKVDKNYLDIHQIKLLAGTNFPFEKNGADSTAYMIIDELTASKLGFLSPLDAIGEVVHYTNDGWKYEVSGIMTDFEYASLDSELGPTAFIQNVDDRIFYMNLEVKSDNMIQLMDKLEAAWRKVDEVHPFRAEFYDIQVQDTYAEYKAIARIFTFLSLIAVSISSLGLLGIVVFTAESRLKEISVRKVLGATEGNLIYLLSRSFVAMLLIAVSIALPAAYYLFDEYILVDFRERISIGAIELLPGVLLIFGIAMAMIVWQTLKAAKTNPSDMLRNE